MSSFYLLYLFFHKIFIVNKQTTPHLDSIKYLKNQIPKNTKSKFWYQEQNRKISVKTNFELQNSIANKLIKL